ncbi:hypothetical protein HYALB_00009111 [Hymenoscyphus albidus]|uniref:Apple domain-containing protein n=1 Tax=Hymenoscyphus albidus TaxID=595503 RepID=A0A9N9Q5B3_9HELO|nr:hypothetical protein HYALB_00009111 [Hymenoscyphus albidus]
MFANLFSILLLLIPYVSAITSTVYTLQTCRTRYNTKSGVPVTSTQAFTIAITPRIAIIKTPTRVITPASTRVTSTATITSVTAKSTTTSGTYTSIVTLYSSTKTTITVTATASTTTTTTTTLAQSTSTLYPANPTFIYANGPQPARDNDPQSTDANPQTTDEATISAEPESTATSDPTTTTINLPPGTISSTTTPSPTTPKPSITSTPTDNFCRDKKCSPTAYPSSVGCTKLVVSVNPSILTRTASITATITGSALSTSTTTSTITSTSTSTVAFAKNTVTSTITSTITGTSTVITTSTTTYTETATETPAPAIDPVYQACSTNQTFFGIGENGSGQGTQPEIDTSAYTGYDCCAQCFQTTGCVGGVWYNQYDTPPARCNLYLTNDATCPSDQPAYPSAHIAFGMRIQRPHDPSGVLAFNGPCGRFKQFD